MKRLGTIQSGFTLLEMVISIVIVGIIATLGADLIGAGTDAGTAINKNIDRLTKSRYALSRMALEISETEYASSKYTISRMRADQITFTKKDGETVDILFASPNVTINYGSITGNYTLIDQVSSLVFSYYQNDGVAAANLNSNVAYIQIDLTSSGTSSYTRTQRIALGNPL